METKSLTDEDGNAVDDYGTIPRVSISLPAEDQAEVRPPLHGHFAG